MRTTVAIDDEVLDAAKRRAQARGTTLSRLVEHALRRELAAPCDPTERPVVPVVSGRGGLRTGVDPASNQALLALVEDDEPIRRR
jgi:hypothetical protein